MGKKLKAGPNSRKPIIHASTHEVGQIDEITITEEKTRRNQ